MKNAAQNPKTAKINNASLKKWVEDKNLFKKLYESKENY